MDLLHFICKSIFVNGYAANATVRALFINMYQLFLSIEGWPENPRRRKGREGERKSETCSVHGRAVAEPRPEYRDY